MKSSKKQRGRPKSGHVKETLNGVRMYPEDKELIKKLFGSYQKWVDQMIKKLKGESKWTLF